MPPLPPTHTHTGSDQEDQQQTSFALTLDKTHSLAALSYLRAMVAGHTSQLLLPQGLTMKV